MIPWFTQIKFSFCILLHHYMRFFQLKNRHLQEILMEFSRVSHDVIDFPMIFLWFSYVFMGFSRMFHVFLPMDLFERLRNQWPWQSDPRPAPAPASPWRWRRRTLSAEIGWLSNKNEHRNSPFLDYYHPPKYPYISPIYIYIYIIYWISQIYWIGTARIYQYQFGDLYIPFDPFDILYTPI